MADWQAGRALHHGAGAGALKQADIFEFFRRLAEVVVAPEPLGFPDVLREALTMRAMLSVLCSVLGMSF